MKSKVRKIKYKTYYNQSNYTITEIIVTHANIKIIVRDQDNKIIRPIFENNNDINNNTDLSIGNICPTY